MNGLQQGVEQQQGNGGYQAKGGGVLLDLCHELDMAHVLFPQARLSHVDCLGHAACPGVPRREHAA